MMASVCPRRSAEGTPAPDSPPSLGLLWMSRLSPALSVPSSVQRWDPRPNMVFVTFENEKDAEAALTEYQDYEIIPGHR